MYHFRWKYLKLKLNERGRVGGDQLMDKIQSKHFTQKDAKCDTFTVLFNKPSKKPKDVKNK